MSLLSELNLEISGGNLLVMIETVFSAARTHTQTVAHRTFLSIPGE